ncbi:glycoside hydrolase family 79 protein [Favolaschia claudopus]|uniref:Glycoside hydrolase family 79 protein n=1 Tax=Favolaschia claudopus TaxID=2862362 RepID=A0AAW0A894_9AGAR
MRFFHFASIAAALPASIVAQNATVVFRPPGTPDKARTVPQGYIGLGIEMKSFPDYMGHGSPNKLTRFLLSQIASRTNTPVPIRVGGTSMDNSLFSPKLTTNFTLPIGNLTQCRLHTNITIGQPWVDAFAYLNGSLARYTLQIPLARKNVTNGIDFANACLRKMPGGLGQVDALEIGNEPNLYAADGCEGKDRGPNFTPEVYARGWSGYARRLQGGVQGMAGTPREFQALAVASRADLSVWNLTKIFTPLDRGGHVKTVSQHYYQGLATGTLQEQLLTHKTTVSKMEHNFRENVAFSQAHNISLVLGEVGPALGGEGAINPSLFRTLGAALWSLDFLLYGMSMGITRVSMQQGTNFRMSAWQPVNGGTAHPKAVHGNFHGLVAAADFIGTGGDFKIRTLPFDDHPEIVGYAGYNSEKLTKVFVLNLHVWNGQGDRSKRDVSLRNLGADVKRVRVSRLTSPNGAADEGNISWAGQQFTAENGGTVQPKGEKPTLRNVNNATSVVVAASEAVLVELLRS